MDKSVVSFIENVLFTTLTNVNFDAEVHVELLRESQRIKEELRAYAGAPSQPTLHATYDLPQTKTEMLRDAPIAGIMYDKSLDPDIRSLRQTVLYGLKGISAYGHQARELGYYSDEADDFYILALEALTDDRLSVEELIRLTMRTGEMAIEVMKKLDEANTTIYQNPAPQKVNVHLKKGPFIIVSGHDLKDLEMLLKQTEGTGIHIYTHGEMLPCHGYPGTEQISAPRREFRRCLAGSAETVRQSSRLYSHDHQLPDAPARLLQRPHLQHKCGRLGRCEAHWQKRERRKGF